MVAATFDTLKYANTLKAAGVPDKQAEAQVAFFADVIQLNFKELVTKDDLALTAEELQRKIAEGQKDLKQEIAEIRRELKQDIAEVRNEIVEVRDELKRDIAEVRKDLKQEIAEVRKDLKQEIAEVRKDLKQEIAEVRKEVKQEIKELEQRLGARIDLLAAEQKTTKAELKGEMYLLKWMMGVMITGGVAMMGLLLRILFVQAR